MEEAKISGLVYTLCTPGLLDIILQIYPQPTGLRYLQLQSKFDRFNQFYIIKIDNNIFIVFSLPELKKKLFISRSFQEKMVFKCAVFWFKIICVTFKGRKETLRN